MKFLNRWILGSLVMALALSLMAGTADAASSKTKKKDAKKTVKKEEKKKKEKKKEKKEAKKESRHETSEKKFVTGTNTIGRAGLFYGDTSSVASVNQIEGSLHLTYSSPASGFGNFSAPLGAHLGLAQDFEVSGALVLNSLTTPSFTLPILGTVGGGTSTTLGVDLGGKVNIAGATSTSPEFSLGGDLYMENGHAVVTPRGTLTFTSEGGFLLNGDFGVHIADPTTYVSFDGGIGVPLGSKWAVIGEIGANQLGQYGSILGGGIRGDLEGGAKLQAFLGIPLNGGGIQVGGGIVLASR